ncbi:peptidylprolyl isomerase [Dipodascopsis tothii]|uniref:peptidylprolyl isomerase n=1 Tax=Dipodascopsis tothii TaxID=44089 RepID=UPI0034CFEACC
MKFSLLATLVVLVLMMELVTCRLSSGMRVGKLKKIAKEDCPRVSKNGDRLIIHYTGTLKDGTKFDSSLDRRKPFEFVLGQGQVIQGWDRGLLGMCVGEKRKLTIPPNMGYGSRPVGPIPADSTLVFTAELLGIAGYTPTEQVMAAEAAAAGAPADAAEADDEEIKDEL